MDCSRNANEVDELVCCPDCKGELIVHTVESREGPGPFNKLYYVCSNCGSEYPLVDDIADFLPRGNGKKKLGQKLMEFEPLIKIYEGKMWRASKVFEWFTHISLDDEIAMINRIADLGPGDRVLDLACGPGIYTRGFAEVGPERKVVGLDLSWPMVRYGSEKARRLGLDNITFLHGDAHMLPFKDSSMDAANCCGAMHLFPDVRQVLRELHRVTKPGGRLSVAAFLNHRDSLWARLDAYVDEKLWGLHSFCEDELKDLLEEAGFAPTIYHARGVWMIAGAERK